MRKFYSHITIWSIDIRDRESGILVDQWFFLFYRQAERYLEKHQKDWKDFEVVLGGEPLWLW